MFRRIEYIYMLPIQKYLERNKYNNCDILNGELIFQKELNIINKRFTDMRKYIRNNKLKDPEVWIEKEYDIIPQNYMISENNDWRNEVDKDKSYASFKQHCRMPECIKELNLDILYEYCIKYDKKLVYIIKGYEIIEK